MLRVLGCRRTTQGNSFAHAQFPINTPLKEGAGSLHINASDREQLLQREELTTLRGSLPFVNLIVTCPIL